MVIQVHPGSDKASLLPYLRMQREGGESQARPDSAPKLSPVARAVQRTAYKQYSGWHRPSSERHRRRHTVYYTV